MLRNLDFFLQVFGGYIYKVLMLMENFHINQENCDIRILQGPILRQLIQLKPNTFTMILVLDLSYNA